MSYLFEIPVSLSPRLAWLQRHNLTITRLENGHYEVALDDDTFARGADEEDAIVKFCVMTKLKHYSEE